MNKIYKNLVFFSFISLLASSCQTIDYEDTNQNPNGPTEAVTSQLFSSALTSMPSILIDETPILYMQHITEGQYPASSRYATLTYSYDGWYTGPLQNLNEVIALNTNLETIEVASAFGDNQNQIATARILRAFYLQYMTDRWGALPWSEAFQGIDNTQPEFDSQESIYNYLFTEVDEALSQINTGASGPTGDFMFGGNMDTWISFGNNLKLTMALRISDVSPTFAQIKFEEAVSSGTLVLTNADNLLYNYGTDDASDSPWEDNFQTREDYIMSVTMVETLRQNLDPRLFEYAEPAKDSISSTVLFTDGSDEAFVGAPNGAVNGNVSYYSFMTSDIIYEPDYPSPIYTAAQIKFSLAEAASKGWNVGGSDATTLYHEGITASMEFWNIESAEISSYITSHPYSDINDIAYEKWVALYLNGPEAWAEWRRLDAPSLTPSSFANDPRIPVRHAYDASIADNNPVNYAAVVAAQGPDNLHTKLWWDIN